MAVYGPYTWDSLGSVDESAWLFADPVGTGVQAVHTQCRWCWYNADASSVGGPTAGQGGVGDGYLYTESSSPAAANDEFTMEFDTTLDASANDIVVEFYTNQRGVLNNALCYLQTNENGAGWVTRASYGGPDDPEKVNDDAGADNWALRSVDLTGVVSDASTRIRIMVKMPATGTIFYNDYGIDTVTITTTPSVTIQQVGSKLNSINVSTPYSVTAGTDLVLIVHVTNEDGSVVGVTFAGQPLTQLVYADGVDRDASLWYLVNPPITSSVVVITDGGAGDALTSVGVTISTWSGVNQTTPFRASNSATGIGAPITVSCNSAVGDVVIDGWIDDNISATAADPSQTQFSYFTHGGDNLNGSSYKAGASPNVTMLWTGTIGTWAAVVGSLQPTQVPCYNNGSINGTVIINQFKVNTVPCAEIASVNTV